MAMAVASCWRPTYATLIFFLAAVGYCRSPSIRHSHNHHTRRGELGQVVRRATSGCSFTGSSDCAGLGSGCQGLCYFYFATNGETWRNGTNRGWGSSDECSYFGVGCLNGSVASLSLSFANLTGTIPDELTTVTTLSNIALAVGSLSGTLPSSLYLMPLLSSLQISWHKISGTIASQTSANLTDLRLEGNQLSGTLSPSLLENNLWRLAVEYCPISGTIPALATAGAHFREFLAQNAALSGSVPTLAPSQTIMQVRNNALSGTLPAELPKSLDVLFVDQNSISGTLADEFSEMPNLRALFISTNQISGTLPTFSNSPNLKFFLGSDTALSGTLSKFGSKLQSFVLMSAKISGTIPKIGKAMRDLALNENMSRQLRRTVLTTCAG
eukprot:TRINITY_DN20025_c0_g1_i1.p1 TRINITY_DN20025_c0_g1~~TRINITY_DN20025_c0_g1_i1.p1  ORF type:complete len:384 (-),score=24.20 TRINITY_DN20025_c0_g1_i1:153-1304(-)